MSYNWTDKNLDYYQNLKFCLVINFMSHTTTNVRPLFIPHVNYNTSYRYLIVLCVREVEKLFECCLAVILPSATLTLKLILSFSSRISFIGARLL
jgi:hypothetical protein